MGRREQYRPKARRLSTPNKIVRGATITPRTRDLFGYAFFAALAATLRMTHPFQILRQQPRNQAVRAEDDHEAAGDDHAAIGKCGHKSQALKPIV